MIVADASAVLAILLGEPDGTAMEDAIIKASAVVMSPVNYWEVLVRAQSLASAAGGAQAEAVIASLAIKVLPLSAEDARQAARAFARYGKPHPARLNLGDCFAYALAMEKGAPLLFKGNDFSQTDVLRV